MIEIEKFVVNPIQENSFLVYDSSKECVIIDAGFYYDEEKNEIDDFIKKNELKPVRLINTHCHFDHIMGVEYLRKKYDIPFEAHEEDSSWVDQAEKKSRLFGVSMEAVSSIDNFLSEKDVIKFGNSELKVIHVPGHSPGHVVFYSEKSNKLFAGDVLFYGSIGRTDLPGGDHKTLIDNIKSKLLVLPKETMVYCGHGPETSIGFEKENNPFLT